MIRAVGARRRPAGVQPGARIVAIAEVLPGVVRVYGLGTYVGDERPPDGTRTRLGHVGLGRVTRDWPASLTTPRLDLDDGSTVWGVACAWLTVDEFKRACAGLDVEVVPSVDCG